MNENGNGGSILTGFVVGALVGAGLALVLAPRSGKDTRRWLADKSRDLKDKTAGAYEQAKETLRRDAKHLGDEVKEVVSSLGMPSYTGAGNKGRT